MDKLCTIGNNLVESDGECVALHGKAMLIAIWNIKAIRAADNGNQVWKLVAYILNFIVVTGHFNSCTRVLACKFGLQAAVADKND